MNPKNVQGNLATLRAAHIIAERPTLPRETQPTQGTDRETATKSRFS
jgi:hypothetical protein